MNSYAHRWRLAVALKQPYPSTLDAGAVTDSEPDKRWFPWLEHMQWAAIGAGAALVVALASQAIRGKVF